MKKFIVFFLLCLCLFCVSLFKKEFDFSLYQNLKVQIFTSTVCQQKFNDVTYVQNGNGQILVCSYKSYPDICKKAKDVAGVTFIFDGDQNLFNDVIKKLNIAFVEQSGNAFVGYTNYFENSIMYQNKKVNVQGYCNNGKIYIGYPLLLGSY